MPIAEPRPEAPSLTLPHFVGAGIISRISVPTKIFAGREDS